MSAASSLRPIGDGTVDAPGERDWRTVLTFGSDHFDELDKWAVLDDDSLEALFTPSVIDALEDIVSLLGDDDEKRIEISRSNFVDLVRKMKQRKHDGSQSLGCAIASGSDLRDCGRFDEAEAVYREFLRTNPSDFYRKIAEHQIQNLRLRGSAFK
jgi:hypothetical protein